MMDAAIAAMREGIARADRNARDDWKAEADNAIRACAWSLPTFTADDVWERLELPHTPAALGPAFLRAAKRGVIEKTGKLRQTKFARRHRALTVWRGR